MGAVDDEGRTPLLIAVDHEGDKVIRVLLDHGTEDKGRIASQIGSANVDAETTMNCETAVRIWCRRRGMLV